MYLYLHNGIYHSDISNDYLIALGFNADGIAAIMADKEIYETNLLAMEQKNAQERKLEGIEFEGVMCSATKEDMWGLSSVGHLIGLGDTVNFSFSNGSTLPLTLDNIDAFNTVWWPFRVSFF
jgi:hypothetical protein